MNYKVLLILLLILTAYSCSYKNSVADKIIIFHAGSLAVPFMDLANEFKKEHPNVEFFIETSGSLQAARKITELNKECDILAVADYLIIDNLLIPKYAESNNVFATNEMIIAYNNKSKYKDSIEHINWYDLVLKEDVIIGRSEPNLDPCGYRTIFLFKLSDFFYNKAYLSEELITKKLTVIRPKEVDLLALLETNNIDYLFIYKSVAQQHNLQYILLPDEINLSNSDLEDYYSKVSLTVTGAKQGETVDIIGSSIVYSYCIPKTVQNMELALDFLSFLKNPEKGGKILERNGMKAVYNR